LNTKYGARRLVAPASRRRHGIHFAVGAGSPGPVYFRINKPHCLLVM
jgi:hypothetical protein